LELYYVNVISILFEQSPIDCTLTIVVKSGTEADEYPARRAALLTPVANAETYPLMFEYRLKGPASAPAVVNVINTVILFGYLF
jgi:hypothetical protein